MKKKYSWYSHIKLDKRLQDTLQLIAEGKTDDQISIILNRSHESAKRDRKKLRSLFQAQSTAELITKSVALGFIDTDKILLPQPGRTSGA
jgi:DNA-binding CsgD family transcriptional regulator